MENQEIFSGIYRIRNLANNKFYLGSSIDLKRRKKQHFDRLKNNDHQKKLQNAYNKHGGENFVFEVVELVLKSSENILEIEQRYLDLLHPYEQGIGYNISKDARGGDTITNHPNKNEIIKKQKDKNLGRHHTQEAKNKIKINNPKYWSNKKRTEETRIKISESLEGRKKPERNKEYCENISNAKKGNKNGMFGKEPWNKGKHSSLETRKKISESKKNKNKDKKVC